MRDAIHSFTGRDVFHICTMCTKNTNAEKKPHSNPADWYPSMVSYFPKHKDLYFFFRHLSLELWMLVKVKLF